MEIICLGIQALDACSYLPNGESWSIISIGDTISAIALLLAFSQLQSLTRKELIKEGLIKTYWPWGLGVLWNCWIFNPEVRGLIEYWITEIEDLGYSEYKKSELFKMLNDHNLESNRQGQHSITLDQTGGRLIYTVVKNAIVIKVIKITSDHDYSEEEA